MRFTDLATDEALLGEIGDRLRRTRLQRNVTQQQLAEQAGISRFTVQRIEDGHSVQLTSLLRALRQLGLIDGLETLVPQPLASPLDASRRARGERQRAAGNRAPSSAEPDPGAWSWGEEGG